MDKLKSENDISLREYFDTKIRALEKATEIAASGMDKRLEGMNEFRNQLKDQTFTFITRNEILTIINRMNDDLKILREQNSELFTRKEHQTYLEKTDSDIRLLRESKANLEGKASQTSVNISLAIAVMSVILALMSLISNFKSNTSSQIQQAPQIQYIPYNTNSILVK